MKNFFKRFKRNKKRYSYRFKKDLSKKIDSYPDIKPNYKDYEEDRKIFLSLKEVVKNEDYREEASLENSTNKKNVHYSNINLSFVPELYIPIDEYTQTDKFFIKLDEE